ncbi:hypothetical protein LWI29_020416 [Acer saccharum]|uniref:Transmembrane protein n=1 Tax=Acer saccharum TaxID=4024 RepID=A0AA39V8I6_ACESA|nr:hypothetical protein LWI29_020416 [Acer saccharum]
MSLTPKSTLFLCLCFSLLFTISTSYSTSIEELLKSQGLPGGLFPRNVKSYDYDELTGRLEVHLESPCLAEFEIEDRVYFEKVVRANLTYGGLFGLEGLTQEELFLWLPVKGIIVNDPSSGLILIDIGFAHKQLSLSLFEDPPVCKSLGINSSSGDQLIEYETNHDQDDKPPVSDHGSGYDEGNNDEYEKIVLQNPSGYGSV